MNEKFNKNAKVEKFTPMLGIAVRLIVIDPFSRKRFPLVVLFRPIWGIAYALIVETISTKFAMIARHFST